MIDYLIIFLVNLVDFGVLHKYLTYFSNKKRYSSFGRKILLFCCVFAVSAINIVGNPNLNLIISILMIFLYCSSFVLVSTYQLLLPTLYIGLGFVTEPIGLLIIKILNFCFENKYNYFVAVVICELIRLVIVLTICHGLNIQLSILSFTHRFFFFMIPISNVIICYIAICISSIFNSLLSDILCALIIVMVLISNILTFTVFSKLCNVMQDKYRQEMLLKEAQAKEKYYTKVAQNNKMLQIFKHDLKNKLLAVSAKAKNNEELLDELNKLSGNLNTYDKEIYTTNEVFNTIINNKVCDAQDKNIEVKVYISIPKVINLDYCDAGILIGNLFDNAIEACDKITCDNRWIDLSILWQDKILILKIRNSKSEENVKTNISSKMDCTHHGIGLRSVKSVVKKYNGVIDISDKGDVFEVSAVLYGIIH